MATTEALLKKVREICLSFPDTTEKLSWGHPHFFVKGRIFAAFDEKQGYPAVSFALEDEHAALLFENDPSAHPLPRYGLGAVSLDVSKVKNWANVKKLLAESYAIVTSKLAATKTKKAKSKKAPARKPPARKKR